MDRKFYSFLGIKVNAFVKEDLVTLVDEAVSNNEKYIIGNHNLHSLYLFHHDKNMQEFYQIATYIHVDGMSIVWLGKLFGHPLTPKNRLTSLDWLELVLEKCAKENLRIFSLGSKPGVGEKAANIFRSKFPGLQFKVQHGYFDASKNSMENQAILKQIKDYRPHIVMLGMGMPRQEKWIVDNFNEIEANNIWNLGAFMDYYAREVPTPPRWMGAIGLEWLYRLLSEPKRLWKRYIIEPMFVIKLLFKANISRKQ